MKNNTEDEHQVVVLRRYLHAYEAHLAKGRLESEGIEAEVEDEVVVGVNWLLSNAVGGVKLCVRGADVERANDILSEEREAAVEPETLRETVEKQRCPNCGSTSVEFEKLSKRLGGWSMILGVPLPVRRNRYRCAQCGHTWKRTKEEGA